MLAGPAWRARLLALSSSSAGETSSRARRTTCSSVAEDIPVPGSAADGARLCVYFGSNGAVDHILWLVVDAATESSYCMAVL